MKKNRIKKIIKYLIYLTAILIYFILIMIFLTPFFEYMKNNNNLKYNIKNIISGFVFVGIVFALMYFYLKKQDKNTKLVEQLFKLDITNDKSEHIRITDNNILFKYYLTLDHFSYRTRKLGQPIPECIVKQERQLNEKEVAYILEEIEKVDNIQNAHIKINYKGHIKYVNCDDINRILVKFDIKI